MSKYPYSEDIELSKLRIDLRNPRLPNDPTSQREAFGSMADVQGAKLIALCDHIVNHGLSPAQKFIVMPDDTDQFVVLDGNRRLTALRALEQPDLITDRLTPANAAELKRLAKNYRPVDDLPCVVFESETKADPWITLIHEGEGGGAGLLTWGAQQKARHNERKGTKPYYMQVLDFVLKEGDPSDKTKQRYAAGRYPVTTLERLLSTPVVRDRLGIEFSAGQVTTKFPKPELLKGLTKAVDEIGTGEIKVGAVMSQKDRIAYIHTFDADDLPESGTRSDIATPIEDAPDTVQNGSGNGNGKNKNHSTTRQKLIPSSYKVTINVSRINDIYVELRQRLKVNEVPNAAGVLLRVFLELSVDEYVHNHQVALPKDKNLVNKATAVADHMESNGIATKHQLHGIREALKNPEKGNIVTTLHALVHNRDMTLGPTDLMALWDRLAVFIQKMWS